MNRPSPSLIAVLVLSCSVLLASFLSTGAGEQTPIPAPAPPETAPTTSSGVPADLREGVLAALPMGAQIAPIPCTYGRDGLPDKTREGLLVADTDGDGRDEIVVAYLALPTFEMREQDYAAMYGAYFQRAHVRVLKEVDGVWREQWDSGGWGSGFGTDTPARLMSLPATEQKAGAEGFLSVRDVTGDERPEVLFSRRSDSANGAAFEVWQWRHGVYVQVAETGGIVGAADGKVTVVDFDEAGEQRTRSLVWNEREHRFVEERYHGQEDDG